MAVSEKDVHASIEPLAMAFLQSLMEHYWGPLHQYLKDHPDLIDTVPGFLVNTDKVVMYIGRTHIAIEYLGSEIASELRDKGELELKVYDYSTKDCNLLEQIVGFEYDSTLNFKMHLPLISEDFLLPTNRGWDKLTELGWNFIAQDSLMVFNTPAPEPAPKQFARMINAKFFDADDFGLKSRHIKWIDFFPVHFDGSDAETDSISFSLKKISALVEHDAHYSYPMPDDYKYIQLPKLNRFIELWGNSKSTEVEITSHLAQKENEFILTMKFGATEVFAELTCEWQSEKRNKIRPDFFVVQPNGYADIVEFKLPTIAKSFIVGGHNRETFAAWLNSYIAQTRVYSDYFDDPNNRAWFESKYGFKVHKPRRWLVVGRRSDFDSSVWREIMTDYRDLEILTFDDLIDGVVVQFYK